jgi:hypothetical protein
MPAWKKTLASVFLFTISIGSCARNTTSFEGDIVGRWEKFNDETKTKGLVLEFTAAGDAAVYAFNTQVGFLYPNQYDDRRYLYSERGDSLSFSGRYWQGGDESTGFITADIYRVSFPTADQLMLTPVDEQEGILLQRAPVPIMPFDARAVLGKYLSREGLKLLSVESLAGSWQEAYPGYVEVDRARFRESTGEVQWLATIQEVEKMNPCLLLIVETFDRWAWILLKKAE